MNPIATLLDPKTKRRLIVGAGVFGVLALAYRFLYPVFFDAYVGKTNAPLTYESSQTLTEAEFEALAQSLSEEARRLKAESVVAEDQDPFARQVKVEMLMNTESFIRDTEPHQVFPRGRHPSVRRPQDLSDLSRHHRGRSSGRHPLDGRHPRRSRQLGAFQVPEQRRRVFDLWL